MAARTAGTASFFTHRYTRSAAASAAESSSASAATSNARPAASMRLGLRE